jgi:polyhydroxyalkanoate synthesis repressor PhaR
LRVVASPARVVKRYGNRKLYDTAASRYVKLDEIADLIRNGVEIKVVEHPSGRDITSAALAHIIFEEETSRSQRSVDVLAEVIRGTAAPRMPRSAPAQPVETEDGVIDRAVHRLDEALNQGHRARAGVETILGSTSKTLERLRATASERVDLAHDVCGGLSRARRDLERIARRLDVLHDRLRSLES